MPLLRSSICASPGADGCHHRLRTMSSGSSGRSVALPEPSLFSIVCLMRRMELLEQGCSLTRCGFWAKSNTCKITKVVPWQFDYV